MVRDAVLSHMVGLIPIEEYDVAGVWGVGVVLSLGAFIKPILACVADSKSRYDAVFKVAAFVGTPTDEDCTPVHSLIKAVPSPIGFTTDIVHLVEGNCNEIPLTYQTTENSIPIFLIFRKRQFVELLLWSSTKP